MKKILIIEDEVELSSLIRTRLVKEGYEVAQAFDGEQGLKLAASYKPDLITLDLKLPIMDGYNVCEQLKNDPELKNMPIIILSARDTDYEKKLGLSLGAEAFIPKPYEAVALLTKIRELVK